MSEPLRSQAGPEGRILVKATPPRPPEAVPLSRYTRFIRRQWPVIAACVVAGFVLGLLRTVLFVDPTYTATVVVLAPPVPLHTGLQTTTLLPAPVPTPVKRRPRESTMDTETQLVHSDEVLKRLSAFPGFHAGREELKQRITMRVPKNTRVLTIMVTADDPVHARDGADIVAEAYLTLRGEILGGIQQRNRESLERRQDLLRKQLAALPGDPAELTRLTVRTRRQAIMRELGEIAKQLSQLEGTATQSGEVVRGGTTPQAADDPGREVSPTTGAGLGLVAGVGLGMLRARRPRQLRTRAEIRESLALPVLAEIRDDPASWRNAGRRLRNLVHQESATTILIVGIPGRVAAEPAGELATALVESGRTVTLLHLDQGNGSSETRLEREDGALDADPRFTMVTFRDLDEDRMITKAIAAARLRSSVVVVVGTGLSGAQTLSVALTCDLNVLVTDVVHALDKELGEGVRALEAVSAKPEGVVLVGGAAGRRRDEPDRSDLATAPG
ncbi:hypothetical protein SMC26_11330 [Actinomadura fulvescens]|uniref:Polysaccharide chain length determinant N-terminal domain-containing protein n=1 Tax=Actinomadura fulvescens TaxID=46160 RepID=A0ABP6C8T6_9ACTN